MKYIAAKTRKLAEEFAKEQGWAKDEYRTVERKADVMGLVDGKIYIHEALRYGTTVQERKLLNEIERRPVETQFFAF